MTSIQRRVTAVQQRYLAQEVARERELYGGDITEQEALRMLTDRLKDDPEAAAEMQRGLNLELASVFTPEERRRGELVAAELANTGAKYGSPDGVHAARAFERAVQGLGSPRVEAARAAALSSEDAARRMPIDDLRAVLDSEDVEGSGDSGAEFTGNAATMPLDQLKAEIERLHGE